MSLGVSVPTLAVALMIIASWELSLRAQGVGPFGWLRRLPWGNPIFLSVAAAMVSALGGGVFANVVIQERIERLTGDTLTIPGYFHFLTLGTATLTFIAFLAYVMPALTGRGLKALSLLRASPLLVLVGVYIFGLAGAWAGYLGAPRRTLDFYEPMGAPEAWSKPLALMGVGGLLAVLGGASLLAAVYYSLLTPGGLSTQELPVLSLKPASIKHGAQRLPVAPFIVVSVLLAGIYAATILAAGLMESMPVRPG